jgi:uncharacterized membrane protein
MGEQMTKWIPRTKVAHILALVVIAYILVFWWLACRKFEYATGEMGDIAAVNHLFWSSLHGKFFWHFGIDRSYFAMHQEWLIFLIWPLYALVPDTRTLLFVQTFCIAISSVPMFLIARRVLEDDWSAVACAVALIMFPSIVSQNVNQLHTSQWVLPLLLTCFYFYLMENYRWFLVFCVLAALGKENTPLTLLMFVPYAVWHRRPKKWWIGPSVVSVLSLILSFKVVGPYFQRGWEYEALGYLSNLGKTWPEVFASLLSPKLFDALFQPANGPYLIQLLQPILWVLPFFAPEVLFAMPDLGTNLIASNTGMKVAVWHYNVYTGGFLVLAAVFAIPRMERLLARKVKGIRLVPVVPLLLAVFAIAHWPFWFSPSQYGPLPQYGAQLRARALIPPDASVLVAPHRMSAHFSNRLKFNTNTHLNNDPQRMWRFDWAFIDMNYASMLPPIPKETLFAFANNPDYELVFREENVFVFRRRQLRNDG